MKNVNYVHQSQKVVWFEILRLHWSFSSRFHHISIFIHQSSFTMRVLATLQPRVPAPRRRHLVLTTLSKSNEGTSLHLISLRFRSTDDSASLQKTNSDDQIFILNVGNRSLPGEVTVLYFYLKLLPFRVHTFTQVDHPGTQGSLWVLLPTNTFRTH